MLEGQLPEKSCAGGVQDAMYMDSARSECRARSSASEARSLIHRLEECRVTPADAARGGWAAGALVDLLVQLPIRRRAQLQAQHDAIGLAGEGRDRLAMQG